MNPTPESLPPSIPGMSHLPCKKSVAETTAALITLATSKGLTIFAHLDFAKDAAAAGLAMHPAQLLLLGNPKSGTPLMLAAPTLAIDLPVKALLWQDTAGNVWLSFNDPDYLRLRHNFPESLLPNIAALEPLLRTAAG